MDHTQHNAIVSFLRGIADDVLRDTLGGDLYPDHNVFLETVDAALKKLGLKPADADLKQIIAAVTWCDESAPPVIKEVHKPLSAGAKRQAGLPADYTPEVAPDALPEEGEEAAE